MARPRLSPREKSARRAFRRLQERNKATLALAQHFRRISEGRTYRLNVFWGLKPEQLIEKDGEYFIETDDSTLIKLLEALEKVDADIGFIEFLVSRCSAVSETEVCTQRFYKTRGRGQPIEREKIEAIFILKSYFESLTGQPCWALAAKAIERISRGTKRNPSETRDAKDIISWLNKRKNKFEGRDGKEEVAQLLRIYTALMEHDESLSCPTGIAE